MELAEGEKFRALLLAALAAERHILLEITWPVPERERGPGAEPTRYPAYWGAPAWSSAAQAGPQSREAAKAAASRSGPSLGDSLREAIELMLAGTMHVSHLRCTPATEPGELFTTSKTTKVKPMAANVFVAENLHLAPREVIVTINEALRMRAVPLHSARRAIQPLPTPFVLVALVTNPTHYNVPLPAPEHGGSEKGAARGDSRRHRRHRRRRRATQAAANASSLPLGEQLQRPYYPLPVPLFLAEQTLFSVSLTFDHPCTVHEVRSALFHRRFGGRAGGRSVESPHGPGSEAGGTAPRPWGDADPPTSSAAGGGGGGGGVPAGGALPLSQPPQPAPPAPAFGSSAEDHLPGTGAPPPRSRGGRPSSLALDRVTVNQALARGGRVRSQAHGVLTEQGAAPNVGVEGQRPQSQHQMSPPVSRSDRSEWSDIGMRVPRPFARFDPPTRAVQRGVKPSQVSADEYTVVKRTLRDVFVHPDVAAAIDDLCIAARTHPGVHLGAGPKLRPSLQLAASALAAVRRQSYVGPTQLRAATLLHIPHNVICSTDAAVLLKDPDAKADAAPPDGGPAADGGAVGPQPRQQRTAMAFGRAVAEDMLRVLAAPR